MTTLGSISYDEAIHFHNDTDESNKNGISTISADMLKRTLFPAWAPTWEKAHDHAFENIHSFKAVDRGVFGDPEFKSLKAIEGANFKHVSPKLGLEINGIQLSQLNDTQKDDLALLVEKFGVIAFRNQDFKYQSFDDIKAFGKHFGPLHVHPTSGAPLGHPEFHLTYRRGSKDEQVKMLKDKLHNISWHSDVTYENQPPGITLFAMLQTGPSGGDTQFIDMFETYDRLSPLMKSIIDDLKVLHTSKDQAYFAKLAGGIERKDPSENIHPLVRRILGLKVEESDKLLLFLLNHIESCLDAHVRLTWDENTVVIWDNRRVIHTATNDWDTEDIRHAFRVTSIAERPVANQAELETWTPELEIELEKSKQHVLNLSPAEYYTQFLSKE